MNPELEATPPPDFAARLLTEFDALRELSPLATLLWLVLVFGVSWALAWVGPTLVRLLWRVGVDRRRRLGLLSSALRLSGLLVAVFGALRPVFVRAPTLGLIFVVLIIALAGLVAPTQLHNLASGLALATRTRLREGDLVRIGALEGTIRDISLLRVQLRTIDGGVTHVPAADFDRQAVTVGSRRAAVPIVVKVMTGPGFDEAALERLRQAVWLCVYRRANTEVRIEHDPRTRALEVRMDTWAANSVVEVERFLRASLVEFTARDHLEDEPLVVEVGS